MKRTVLLASLAALALIACTSTPARTPSASMPEAARAAGLVDVAALVPDAHIDMRYAGHDNFVGVPVEGYGASRCWLHRQAAEALSRVATDLRTEGLRLHIYDCYRPARAVAHFMRWAQDANDQRTKPAFYPNLEKSTLVKGGYIAERSGHSRAATLDLGIERCDADGRCADIDMGTPFDFFDSLANTDDPRVTPLQRVNRDRLRDAMRRHGFAPYAMEWWHFTFKPEPTPDTFFDIPIE